MPWIRFNAYMQIATSSLSLVASSTAIIAIYRSPKRLLTPYRRIIFSLSVFDCLQSFGFLTGNFLTIQREDLPWAIGNVHTCEFNGAIFVAGFSGVPFYTMLLCVYYLCKTKYSMTNDRFSNKIERRAHITIITFCIAFVIYAIATKSMNPLASGSLCNISAFPSGCRQHPEIFGECTRGLQGPMLSSILYFAFPALTYPTIIISSIMLYAHAFALKRGARERRTHIIQDPDEASPPISREVDQDSCDSDDTESQTPHSETSESKNIRVPSNSDGQRPHETRAEYIARLYRRETLIQVTLYVVAFIGTYSLVSILAALSLLGLRRDRQDLIYLLTVSVYPTGGILNILIYTRPKISLFREKHPKFSWVQALFLVMKEGGDLPSEEKLYGISVWFSSCCANEDLAERVTTMDMDMVASSTFPTGHRVESTSFAPSCNQVLTDGTNRVASHESLPYHAPPSLTTGMDGSISAINGLSESFDKDSRQAEYRSESNWNHVAGSSAISEDSLGVGFLHNSVELQNCSTLVYNDSVVDGSNV